MSYIREKVGVGGGGEGKKEGGRGEKEREREREREKERERERERGGGEEGEVLINNKFQIILLFTCKKMIVYICKYVHIIY